MVPRSHDLHVLLSLEVGRPKAIFTWRLCPGPTLIGPAC